MSLSGLMDELSQTRTKKKEFLEQMDELIPWGKWVEEIKPCYYKGERGNKPYGIELMLRLYVVQNLYTLSDEGTVAEVIDSRAFSDFCGVETSTQVLEQPGAGRRYAGAVPESADPEWDTGEAVCAGDRAAGGAGTAAEKRYDRRFDADFRTVKYKKRGKEA